MRKFPYQEIINLKAERIEYVRLCNGKSKQFKFYTEWEKHIKDLLSSFGTKQDLYNFKRYCINAARVQEKSPEMFLTYVSLLIPLYINILFEGIPAIISLICLFFFLFCAIAENKKLAKESCFFRDITEIIEILELEQEAIWAENRLSNNITEGINHGY